MSPRLRRWLWIAAAVLLLLVAGVSAFLFFERAKVMRVTIPEGFTRFDIARRLERQGICAAEHFLEAAASPELIARMGLRAKSLEGYLFPDTYLFFPSEDRCRGVVERMLAGFEARTAEAFAGEQAGLAELQRTLGFGRHEALILASIVEKEARVADERAVIAGVFLNRLRDPSFTPHRLQADPTAAYGCLVDRALIPSCAGYDGKKVTPAIVSDAANPYNTYRIEGLPPGPISNPGLASIRAVLAPAKHDYFYFVTHGGGRHVFSRTLAEHNEAIRRGQ